MTRASVTSPRLRLSLYVVGDAPNSVRAVANAKRLCDEHFAANYDLEIVDLLRSPQRALADGVIVTPTLVRLHPLPIQRVIGDLSDAVRVLEALSIS